MKKWIILLFFPLLLQGEDLFLKTRLSSLDPLSVSEHLAFYELYPLTKEGQKALGQAWHLLSGGKVKKGASKSAFRPSISMQ
jgi:hypothetical protein